MRLTGEVLIAYTTRLIRLKKLLRYRGQYHLYDIHPDSSSLNQPQSTLWAMARQVAKKDNDISVLSISYT